MEPLKWQSSGKGPRTKPEKTGFPRLKWPWKRKQLYPIPDYPENWGWQIQFQISGNFSCRICPKAHSFITTRHGNVINRRWIFLWSNVLRGLLIFHQCYKLLKYTIFVKHIQNRSTKEPRDDPTMSIVPGGPSPWGRSTLHLGSLLLQAVALSTKFAPRLLCLW